MPISGRLMMTSIRLPIHIDGDHAPEQLRPIGDDGGARRDALDQSSRPSSAPSPALTGCRASAAE